jgi:hypothetical protein
MRSICRLAYFNKTLQLIDDLRKFDRQMTNCKTILEEGEMKKKINIYCCLFLIVGILLLLNVHPSMAATYCVANDIDLNLALYEAQNNGSNDLIKIQQGTYVGGFDYSSSETFNLTIEGGYNAGCTSRTVDASNTVFDAKNGSRVLNLSTPDVFAFFLIDGITLQNGYIPDFESDGGGLNVVTLGTVTLRNSIVRNNYTHYGDGGGISIKDSYSVNLSDNIINNNETVYGFCGGISITGTLIAYVGNNNIHSNRSGELCDIGGIGVYSDRIIFNKNNISYNTSGNGSGVGGVSVIGSDVTLTNNIISHNQATNWFPGGVDIASGEVITLAHNTIVGNSILDPAGGPYIGGLSLLIGRGGIANIYNNIIWNNSKGNQDPTGANDIYLRNFPSSTVNLYNNNFDQSEQGTFILNPFSIDPSNLDNEDPLFVDDYHLSELSPCRDSGVDAEVYDDIDGDSRPLGAGYDIGADEYPTTGGNPGDDCGEGMVLDCVLNCVDAETADAYIGDGYCDDGTWGYVLTCPEFDDDGGDCGGTGGNPGDSCGSGMVLDCTLNCVDAATADSYIGDGFCDDGEWGFVLTCPAFNDDGGDCGGGGGTPGDACDDGMVLDCALNCVDAATAQLVICYIFLKGRRS